MVDFRLIDTLTASAFITVLAILIGGWWLFKKLYQSSSKEEKQKCQDTKETAKNIIGLDQLEKAPLETLKPTTIHEKDTKGFWPQIQPEDSKYLTTFKSYIKDYVGQNAEHLENIKQKGISKFISFMESKSGNQVPFQEISDKLYTIAFEQMQLILLGPLEDFQLEDINQLKEYSKSMLKLWCDHKSAESSLSVQKTQESDDLKEKFLNVIVFILKKLPDTNKAEKTYAASNFFENTNDVDDENLKLKGSYIAKLLVTGTESLYRSMEACLASVSTRSNIQEKILDEIKSVRNSQNLTAREIIENKSSLLFTTAVVLEALRLHDVVPKVAYRDRQDKNDEGIPGETEIFAVDLHSILIDPVAWENPKDFVPQRFLDSFRREMSQGKDFALLSFGSEKSCPVQAFVVITSLVLITSLVQKFHLLKASLTKDDDNRDLSNGKTDSYPNLSIVLRNPILH